MGLEMALNQGEKSRAEAGEEIAILLAACNGERYLAEQLDSLLDQSFTDWRLYVHDDGSKDGTNTILKAYAGKYPNRIRLIQAPPTGGAKDNFLFLLRTVDAPYIMFCDQDDVWMREKIEKTYRRMQMIEGEGPALVFTDLQVVDRDRKLIAPRMSRYQKLNLRKSRAEDFLAENVVTGCTVMINRKMAELARKAEDPSKIIMHDWWIALAAARFGSISCLEEALVQYRQHEVNSIGAKKLGKEYILERLTHGKEVRDAIQATRTQAGYMADIFALGPEDVITQYGRLSERNKAERLRFYASRRICKSGLARNIGLLLWG